MYTLSGTGDGGWRGGGVDVMTELGDRHKTRQPFGYIRKACLRSTEANHEQAYLRSVHWKGDRRLQLGNPQLRR